MQHPQPAADEIRTSDGHLARPPSTAEVAERVAEYGAWIERARRAHTDFTPTRAHPLHWTPLRKPLSQCAVALVSTGGVHLDTQQPFDVYAETGDWSARPIPGDVDSRHLIVTHTHYATQDALADVNVMFPIDRLRELVGDGVVGEVASLHFAFMGFIPNPRHLVAATAPAAAAALKARGVDAVVLTAG